MFISVPNRYTVGVIYEKNLELNYCLLKFDL